jgi:hypothetical protein
MPTRTRVEVPALCEFEHEGRCYVRGEIVKVPPVVALALARLRKVSLGRHAVLASAPTYNRRDMRAEE